MTYHRFTLNMYMYSIHNLISCNNLLYGPPQLLFLVNCVHLKIGFLHRLCISKFHDTHCTKQGTIKGGSLSQPGNDNVQVSN